MRAEATSSSSSSLARSALYPQQQHPQQHQQQYPPPAPPGGGNPALTHLSPDQLQDMAHRQQSQIEAQQQMLVAKEQRLKYLRQQDYKRRQMAAEYERLRRLREKASTELQNAFYSRLSESSPSLSWQQGKGQQGWYNSETVRKQFTKPTLVNWCQASSNTAKSQKFLFSCG